MNKQWLKTLLDKRGTTILAGTGIALNISAFFAMGRASVTANRVIEAKIEECERPLTTKEKAELTWKYYILPCALLAAGNACSGVAISKSNKKQGIIMAAAGATETAYTRLKEEIPEVVGKKKAEEIDERVSQKAAKDNNPRNGEGVEIIKRAPEYGSRNTLVYDRKQGRWFYTNTEEIKHVENIINHMINSNTSEPVVLDEVNFEFGLKGSDTGAENAWIGDYQDRPVTIGWTGCNGDTFLKEDGTEEPYLILWYDPEPKLMYADM